MKLAILSRNSKLYSTRRLVEAARERHHSVRVLDPLRCYLRISSDGFGMHYKGKPISGYAAVQGTQLSLQASGPDAEDALTALDELVRQGFGEMNAAESSEPVATDENRQAG